jgi:hypothetical protein
MRKFIDMISDAVTDAQQCAAILRKIMAAGLNLALFDENMEPLVAPASTTNRVDAREAASKVMDGLDRSMIDGANVVLAGFERDAAEPVVTYKLRWDQKPFFDPTDAASEDFLRD